jgi:hypothetical protein
MHVSTPRGQISTVSGIHDNVPVALIQVRCREQHLYSFGQSLTIPLKVNAPKRKSNPTKRKMPW